MRHLRTIAAICFALITIIMVTAVPSVAQDDQYWPGYHRGARRDGTNREVRSLEPGSLRPIWAFPRPDDPKMKVFTDIVDDSDITPSTDHGFFDPGSWGPQVLDNVVNAWNDNYTKTNTIYDPKVDMDKDGQPDPGKGEDFLAANRPLRDWVRWKIAASTSATLPPVSTAGAYRVYVWFPTITGVSSGGSVYSPTKYAHYRVVDVEGRHDYIIDQTEGGQWIALGDRGFRFDPDNDPRGEQGVYLERVTKDALDNTNPINNPGLPSYGPTYLIADAVKFVSDTGMEMWASPSIGNATINGVVRPLAFVGTVEGSTASGTEINSLGAMYAVYSDTLATGVGVDDVGKVLWKYPEDISTSGIGNRHPVEGPIGAMFEDKADAGVYSSPVYFKLPGGVMLPDGSDRVVVFAGSDRQVYCLNATTGDLVWKGPGITVPEPSTPAAGWVEVPNRNDAFGGSYLRHTASAGGTGVLEWNRTPPSSHFRKYAVYAWLPAKTEVRIPDATYKIYYNTGDPANGLTRVQNPDVVTVKMDKNDPTTDSIAGAEGVWVRLGTSYFEPYKVELLTTTKATGTRYVVADAVMFVPDDVRNFSYSSPTVNFLWQATSPSPESIEVGSPAAVYIANNGGRVYSLDVTNFDPSTKSTQLNWVFPRTQRGDPVVIDEGNPSNSTIGEPPFGTISSSVSVDSTTNVLYVTSTDGRVYKLKDINTSDPKLDWAYPSLKSSIKPGAFTSSVAISSDQSFVYAASSDGYLYKLSKTANTTDPDDPFPTSEFIVPLRGQAGAGDEVGLGAFRYSTPAIHRDSAGREIVVAASTDGRVYSFVSDSTGLIKNTNWERGRGIGDYRDTATSIYAPMQASPAVDGGYMSVGSVPTVFVAGQDGAIWWMNSYDGSMPWEYAGFQTDAYDYGIFASPALANGYLYVAGTDGRLWALTGRGGAWGADPQWLGGGDDPYHTRMRKKPDPMSTESPQVDIFSYYPSGGNLGIYKETYDIVSALANPTTDVITSETTGIFRTNIDNDVTNITDIQSGHRYALRNSGKLHFLEWGEDIYVIAWNLDPSMVNNKTGVSFKMNNASAGSGSGMMGNPKPADWIALYQDSSGRRKCVAGARIQVGQSSDKQPSPGYGWVLTVTSTVPASGTPPAGGGSVIGVVPELNGSPGNWTMRTVGTAGGEWIEQKIGINNPLGMYTKYGNPATEKKLGWESTMTGLAARAVPSAHFNGNMGEDTANLGKLASGVWPELPFGNVDHGTDSTALSLGILDRSAVGLIDAGTGPRRQLDKFKIQNRDLQWTGGESPDRFKAPWEQPRRYSQADYPDIYKRYESFNQQPDGSDPSQVRTALLPPRPNSAMPGDYNTAKLQPQSVATTVSVPRFQPANSRDYGRMKGRNDLRGYYNRMTAFIDSNNNNAWDSGDIVSGKITTYQEAYREFDMHLEVPPDYRMSIEETTLDIGAVPHGFGESVPGPQALTASNSYLPAGVTFGVDKWFKNVTVKNLGNVNMRNIELAKFNLTNDSGDTSFPLPWNRIVSSLDDQFFRSDEFMPFNHQAVITKARVGDPDPTTLTLPDSRAYQNFGPGFQQNVKNKWAQLYAAAGLPAPTNLPDMVTPKVSVGVPLTQPRGIYGTKIGFTENMGFGNRNPVSQPFLITVDVREGRLTNGFTAGALPMIDNGSGQLVGDVMPAAWRDRNNKNVYLIWASNRFGTSTPIGPNDPWYLLEAALQFNGGNAASTPAPFLWQPDAGNARWWADPTGGNQIPAFGWPPGLPITGLMENTIKHTSPYVAIDPYPANPSTWLFWQGQADFQTSGTGMKREYRIFYTNADGGQIGAPGNIYSFDKDLNQVKMQPRAVTYINPNDSAKRLMWLFWYGGDSGKWQLYFSRNVSPADGQDPMGWSSDGILTTPAALASVSEPTPILRNLGGDLENIDVIYSGLFKQQQNSDILMTRYKGSPLPANSTTNTPSMSPKKLPRQYGEVLKRDPKRNVFQAAHIGWIKPSLTPSNPLDQTRWTTTNWNEYTDRPFIKVVIPDNNNPNNPIVLWATSGASQNNANCTLTADRATGFYVYTYKGAQATADPNGLREQYLKQMVLDPSGGTVRFARMLPAGAKVVAEYTPQTFRLTQGVEVDSSPYAFIEKTENMTYTTPQTPYFKPKPGTDSDWSGSSVNTWRDNPVDRLWVFWRKPNTSGVQASTIYYKTYRLTLEMPKQFPIDVSKLNQLTIESGGNPVGPYEVDSTGTRIYFSEVHEKYYALEAGNAPSNVITVNYQARDLATGNSVDHTVTVDGLVNRIVWEQELPKDMPDQALLGWGADTQKNEGQVCAFADVWPEADPWYKVAGARVGVTPTRVWVFWMSTRAGNTDLYYETICPDFRAKGK